MKRIILGNGSQWLEHSLRDFTRKENCKLINSILPCSPRKLRFARIHFSKKLNSFIKIPFKSVWYKSFCRFICANRNEELIVIIYDWNKLGNNPSFLRYLKRFFCNIKLVYVFTNIISITGATKNKFVEKLKFYYDLVYAFDEADSLKYSFKTMPLVYSYNPIEAGKVQKTLFFAGEAKDRLGYLLSVHSFLRKIGICTNFHILNVDEKQKQYEDEIKYNQRIPYEQVIKETKESMALIEIPQKNSGTFTIKICEAIFYDKILITTNQRIKSAPFYNPDLMFVIEKPEDIKKEWFDRNELIKYSAKQKYYFSVDHFLDTIDDDLKNQEK